MNNIVILCAIVVVKLFLKNDETIVLYRIQMSIRLVTFFLVNATHLHCYIPFKTLHVSEITELFDGVLRHLTKREATLIYML